MFAHRRSQNFPSNTEAETSNFIATFAVSLHACDYFSLLFGTVSGPCFAD
jgi:hypothetical protein